MSAKKAKAVSRSRVLVVLVVLTMSLTGIAGRLVYVQALAADRFQDLAAEQRERRIVLAAQRGSIYDRDGSELALSRDMKTLYANPRLITDPKAAAESLAAVVGVDRAELESRLSEDRGFVYVARKVDEEIAEQAIALGIPGVAAVNESKRFYPAGQLAAHVIGFVGMDNNGLGALEERYDGLLRGASGELFMERDPAGRPIPAGKSFVRQPTAGDDLVLTLDREIQFIAESVLESAVQKWSAKGGTIIVMKPGTGEILALANSPTFDPNEVGLSSPDQRKNRALVDVFEPGSANKVITAAAALESGVVSPDDVLTVPDNLRVSNKVFRDAHPHPTLKLSFAEVIEQSSNIGTIKVALDVGKERLHEYLSRFGYGRPTGLDFPGESGGILPDTANWWNTSMGTIPIGQGVAVTGMQIMNVYGTVANDGIAVQPRLLAATIDSNGQKRKSPPAATRRVIKSETAEQLTSILVRVTEGKHGTGKAAAIPGYQVAGKTGTAQKPRTDGQAGYAGYIGSFIGFAPAGDPQLVVGVILDEPSPIWGGVTAGPAFKEVMQFSLRHLGIGPGPVLPLEGTPLPTPDRSGDVAKAAPDPAAGPPVPDGTAD